MLTRPGLPVPDTTSTGACTSKIPMESVHCVQSSLDGRNGGQMARALGSKDAFYESFFSSSVRRSRLTVRLNSPGVHRHKLPATALLSLSRRRGDDSERYLINLFIIVLLLVCATAVTNYGVLLRWPPPAPTCCSWIQGTVTVR